MLCILNFQKDVLLNKQVILHGLLHEFGHMVWLIHAQVTVSDWNLFRVNQNYSDSFRYLYPSQCESFRTNPENVLYLVSWKKVQNKF